MTYLPAADDVAQPDEPQPLGAGRTHREILLMLSGLMLGMLLGALDQTIVATALPTIVGELGGLERIAWVTTAYLLTATVSTPLWGKLGDLYGRKHLMQIAITVFVVGSAVAGFAHSMTELVVYRALQGLGGGGLMVLAQASIADIVPPRERSRYQGYLIAVFAAASVGGPLVGGVLTEHLSWRWLFYINVPLGALAMLVTQRFVPSRPRVGTVRIDYLGSALLSGAVVCLVLMLTWGGGQFAWSSATILGLAGAAVVLFVGFVPVERRATEPLIPLELFRVRAFVISAAVCFVIGVAMFGAVSFLPLFLQVVQGADPTDSGLTMLPLMLGLMATALGGGRLVARIGRYRTLPIVGTGAAALGMGLLASMNPLTGPVQTMMYMVVLGAGLGLVMPVLILVVQNSVPMRHLGVATATVSFCQAVGGSAGVAVMGTLFSSRLTHELGGELPGATAGEGGGGLPVDAIQQLGEPVHTQVVAAFSEALTFIFMWSVPALLVAFVLTWLTREQPLRSFAAPRPPF